MLYLHGGGYLVGSPTSHRALIVGLSRATGTPVHAVDYRLAPEHPYPAAVDDALAAFRALRDAAHPAGRIAVAGDSADEVLVDDADRLVERARAAGVPVSYHRADGMWHAFPVLAGTLREADRALGELGVHLRADCAG